MKQEIPAVADDRPRLSRRDALLAGGGALLLGGCDRLNASPAFRSLLGEAEGLHARAARAIGGDRLAREYAPADMSPEFRANGNRTVDDLVYRRHLRTGFAEWRLLVDGLVAKPLALPLAALMAMEQRAQITRHDCVEGWSAIGQWQGPQLARVLALAGLSERARYIVFHCADRFGDAPYYESVDMADALHPQTILAWRMNGAPLPEAHGAPLRLRVERQLGYKHAKFVMRIEARDTLAGIGAGKGGYWEDRGYAWWAGI